MNLTQAAKKLGVSQDTLSQWESGAKSPTIVQLRRAGRTYGRPLAVLLLPEPPADFDALRDFRRLTPGHAAWSPEMHVEYRRALSQREVMLELSELSPTSVPEPVSLPQFGRTSSAEKAGAALRSHLGIDFAWQLRLGPANEALNAWISKVESRGIVVMQTKGVSRDEMRGFSLSEWPYPVVALNGSEWPRPKLFTLLHEVAHLALNLGGLCDQHEVPGGRMSPALDPRDDIEHFCNQVAASALVPADALSSDTRVARGKEGAWTLDLVSSIASAFGVSSEAMLLRLISLRDAEWSDYWRIKPELERQYDDARAELARRQREREGGPSFYVVKARDLGHGYAASVFDAYRNKRITSMDAATYLDVRYSQLPKLEVALH